MPPAAPRGRSMWHSRRATLFLWQVAGLAIAALVIVAAKAELPPLETWQIFTDTLAFAWLAALASTLLLDALVARQPYVHFTVALVSIAAAFGALFIGLLGTHAAYSRWAIVIGVMTTALLHAYAWKRWRRGMTLRLAVVDEALLARLAPASRFPSDASSVDRCSWFVLGEGAAPPEGVDGVVLPDDASGTYRQGRLAARQAGRHAGLQRSLHPRLAHRPARHRARRRRLPRRRADELPLHGAQARPGHCRRFDAERLCLAVDDHGHRPYSPRKPRLRDAGAATRGPTRQGLFGMYKLRTMAELGKERAQDPQSRITPLGYWLRRFRFDELPQLWNVLRGDMSLIGPRPEWIETAADLERKIPQFAFRYLVRPGITGWAQVHLGHVTAEQATRVKLEYDLYYAKNMSLALDVAIGAMTIRTVLTGKGAR